LLEEIHEADLPEDVKAFLEFSAHRHIVFDYQKIAEFYAHADPTVQNLMERSALVIIDFNKAIENGFVQMTKEIAELSDE
jgi:tRNA A-37 threonylcarbamoyl transferase component Bud32